MTDLTVSTVGTETWYESLPALDVSTLGNEVWFTPVFADLGYDPHWANTTLLLHLDGAEGSSVFTDVSARQNTVARASTATTITETVSKFGGACCDLGGSTYGLSIDDPDAVDFGSGPFTAEMWVRFTSYSTGITFRFFGNIGTVGHNHGWSFGVTSGTFYFFCAPDETGYSPNIINTSTPFTAPTLNEWYHIAIDRDVNNLVRFYINGIVVHSATIAATIFRSTKTFYIGSDGNSGRTFPGQIDEVRITRGVARYAGFIQTPTAAFHDVGLLLANRRRRRAMVISSG